MSVGMQRTAFRHLSAVRRQLRAEFGAGVPIPCGKTAEAVEACFTFDALPSLAAVVPCPTSLYRLHFEIDAENISDDHVVFAVVDGFNGATIFHSYTNIHPVCVRRVPLAWLEDAQAMLVDEDGSKTTHTWSRLFELHRAPPFFEPPVSVSCHVSVTRFL